MTSARVRGVVAAGRGELEALLGRVGAERRDDLLARGGERALGQVLADEVDGGDQRLGLDRQQPRRAGEVVRVRLGVDLDPAVVADLGVEHVRAAAEVHDVQDVDVLAQLLVGDLQAIADVLGAQAQAGTAGVDEDRGQRDEAGEALGADRGRVAAAVAVPRCRLAPRPRRAAAPAAASSGRRVALGERARRPDLGDELRRALDAGVLAEPEDPGDEQAHVRVRRS